MSSETLKAVLGIALVVGFIVIIVLCVMADKNANKKFMKKIADTYKIKEKSGNMVLTTNNEIMFSLVSGTLNGYKLFRLEDIAYVGFYHRGTEKTFSFLDENKKAMKGEYLTPSKKPLAQKKMAAFPTNSAEFDQIYDFIKNHKSDVVKIVNGQISE